MAVPIQTLLLAIPTIIRITLLRPTKQLNGTLLYRKYTAAPTDMGLLI